MTDYKIGKGESQAKIGYSDSEGDFTPIPKPDGGPIEHDYKPRLVGAQKRWSMPTISFTIVIDNPPLELLEIFFPEYVSLVRALTLPAHLEFCMRTRALSESKVN